MDVMAKTANKRIFGTFYENCSNLQAENSLSPVKKILSWASKKAAKPIWLMVTLVLIPLMAVNLSTGVSSRIVEAVTPVIFT